MNSKRLEKYKEYRDLRDYNLYTNRNHPYLIAHAYNYNPSKSRKELGFTEITESTTERIFYKNYNKIHKPFRLSIYRKFQESKTLQTLETYFFEDMPFMYSKEDIKEMYSKIAPIYNFDIVNDYFVKDDIYSGIMIEAFNLFEGCLHDEDDDDSWSMGHEEGFAVAKDFFDELVRQPHRITKEEFGLPKDLQHLYKIWLHPDIYNAEGEEIKYISPIDHWNTYNYLPVREPFIEFYKETQSFRYMQPQEGDLSKEEEKLLRIMRHYNEDGDPEILTTEEEEKIIQYWEKYGKYISRDGALRSSYTSEYKLN